MQVRRCINCRHYEPSPLRGKGWCRNPLLHKRTENFLVDGRSLRCRTTFRDYWEPVPQADVVAHSSKKSALTRRGTKPLEASMPINAIFQGSSPVGLLDEGFRRATRRPRRRIFGGSVRMVLVAVAVIGWIVLALFLMKGQASQVSLAEPTPTVIISLAPGSGSLYPTPAPGTLELKRGGTAIVSGTGGLGLKVRSAPDIAAPVIRTLKEGSPVTLKAGPEERGGYRWWQIDDGQGLGWVVQDWLSPSPR